MNIKIKYVIDRKVRGRTYYYFRKGDAPLEPLSGVPGSKQFSDRYQQLLAERAPKVSRAVRGGDAKGTLAWVIEQFTAPGALPWSNLKPSSQEVYRRIFDWLRENFGDIPVASFDKQMLRRIRDQRKDNPTVANRTVDKFGQLWDWAEEFADLTLPGGNPARQVQAIASESKAAPTWPAPLCAAFEAQEHKRMVTFYFLARYTGQRRGDCGDMKWTDFDGRHIYVVQEKTGEKLWVPAHRRLREHLMSLPREGEYILTSPKGGRYASTSITNLVCKITKRLGFVDADGDGFSPHGLRHLAGAALAEAGCTVNQIMSVLSHVTEKQAYHYVRQANRGLMADDAMRLWEASDDRAAASENVLPFHASERTQSEQTAAKVENKTGKRGAK